MTTDRWIIGVTGASGVRYALRLIQQLTQVDGEYHLVFSEAGLRVLNLEEGIKLSYSNLSVEKLIGSHSSKVYFHSSKDIGASIASGSFKCKGMVIVPCTMGTLGAIAAGISTNLIHRSADVTIKEGRKLILVPRETPLSTIHLENMLKLSRLGAVMLPAMPGFYHNPQNLVDMVDMIVMKILDAMGIESTLVQRWGEEPAVQEDLPAVFEFRRT